MSRAFRIAVCFTVLLVGTARAAVVVPNSGVAADLDGTFSLTSTAAAGRTFQLLIDSAQLSGIVGQDITALQWRLNAPGTAAWPPANANYASWDVFIGPGVDPSAMSNTFASNFSGAATQVRSGAHSWNAGAFTFGSTPNAFGPALTFTSPYTYSGGDLLIEMRFSAQTGATTQSPFDAALASGGPANGWGVDFAGRWTSSITGVTGANANFLATNLVTGGVVPEPSAIALAGISMALAFRRQRRSR